MPDETPMPTADESGTPIPPPPIQAEDPYEGAVPPGYDWPTHGGYLGCLMGIIASCLIGGFLSTTLLKALRVADLLPWWGFLLLATLVLLVCAVVLGRVGWALGRRFYRAYPQPAGPTWGESDVVAEMHDVPPPPATPAAMSADYTEADEHAESDTGGAGSTVPR